MNWELLQSVRKQVWGIIGTVLVISAIGLDWHLTGSLFLHTTIGIALGLASVGAFAIHWRKRYEGWMTVDEEAILDE